MMNFTRKYFQAAIKMFSKPVSGWGEVYNASTQEMSLQQI